MVEISDRESLRTVASTEQSGWLERPTPGSEHHADHVGLNRRVQVWQWVAEADHQVGDRVPINRRYGDRDGRERGRDRDRRRKRPVARASQDGDAAHVRIIGRDEIGYRFRFFFEQQALDTAVKTIGAAAGVVGRALPWSIVACRAMPGRVGPETTTAQWPLSVVLAAWY